jgi:hypothetical protein
MSTEAQELIAQLEFPDIRPELREELHHAWRVAADEARLAFGEWSAAGTHELDRRYFAYVAAADREHAAAVHLQRNVEASAG